MKGRSGEVFPGRDIMRSQLKMMSPREYGKINNKLDP
jgi:hypothetical protein